MFFRFGGAFVLVVLISLGGVALEKQTLELRRNVSRQHYQMDLLQDAYVRAHLQTQELGAPERLIHSLESGELELKRPESSVTPGEQRMPLLHWQRAAGAGLDFPSPRERQE